MSISLPSARRVALLGLLLVGLVLMADAATRVELARAVDASWNDGARVVAHVVTADD